MSMTRTLSWGLEYLCYQRALADFILALSPASTLEVGCGDGVLIGTLSKSISRCKGVDLDARALAFASAFYPNVEFAAEDAKFVKENFDVVVAAEVLEHVPDDGVHEFLKTLCDRLNPQGHLVISVPTTVVPVNRKHYRHYDIKRLKEEVFGALQADVELTDVQYVYKHSLLLSFYVKVCFNRFWTFEPHFLRRAIWNYVWRKRKAASESNGRHLIAIFRKRHRAA